MATRRKDSAGRVLKNGESQRKDGRYMYRYVGDNGKRCSIYAKNLSELREKEEQIKKTQQDGINYRAGLMTVEQLLRKYIDLKKEVLRYNTLESYEVTMLSVQRDMIGAMAIKDVKNTDVREFFLRLHQAGKTYGTLKTIRAPLKCAFELAVDEDILRKNPISVKLDFIPDNTKKRVALTMQQQKDLLEFVRVDKYYKIYYDKIIVLIDTGLRIGEFCGLTMDDLDFANKRISVNHQLIHKKDGGVMIEKTKTDSGERFIPMTSRVYQSLQNLIAVRERPDVEPVVDGYTNLLCLNQKGKPLTGGAFAQAIRNLIKHYREKTGKEMPNVTPHVFRHTFCTNLVSAGADVKTVQYLMGHANVNITLDIYAHSEYDRAEKSIKAISNMMQ